MSDLRGVSETDSISDEIDAVIAALRLLRSQIEALQRKVGRT